MRSGSSRVREGARRSALVGGLLALVLMAVSAAPAVSAGANATLTVRLVPGAVSAGQSALAVAVFHNVGPVELPNVVVDLHFSSGLTVGTAPGCATVGGSAVEAVCSFGAVASGASRKAYVTARVSKNLGQAQKVNVHFALRVGPGRPQPILTGASAKVLASNNDSEKGSCSAKPAPITRDARTTRRPRSSPPSAAAASLDLLCTPLTVGVEPKPASGGYKTKIASRRAAGARPPDGREADVPERDASRTRGGSTTSSAGHEAELRQPEPALDARREGPRRQAGRAEVHGRAHASRTAG